MAGVPAVAGSKILVELSGVRLAMAAEAWQSRQCSVPTTGPGSRSAPRSPLLDRQGLYVDAAIAMLGDRIRRFV